MVQQGECLCGAVKLIIKEDPKKQLACHCLDCQKLAGGPSTTNVFVDDDKFEMDGLTRSYRNTAASGNEVEHIFCPECGTPIGNRSRKYAGKTCLRSTLFPGLKSIPFLSEIYVKDRFDAIKPIEGAAQRQNGP